MMCLCQDILQYLFEGFILMLYVNTYTFFFFLKVNLYLVLRETPKQLKTNDNLPEKHTQAVILQQTTGGRTAGNRKNTLTNSQTRL